MVELEIIEGRYKVSGVIDNKEVCEIFDTDYEAIALIEQIKLLDYYGIRLGDDNFE